MDETSNQDSRFRCARYRCELRIADCVRRQVDGISGCENCLQGVTFAHAAGVPITVKVRPLCRGPGCHRHAVKRGFCEGHRWQLRVWGYMKPLRKWVRRTTA
jgi:hypothetical protein